MYAQPQEGNSPLYKAAEKGDARAVELLLMHKADPCAQNNVRMFTNAWDGRGWDGGEGGGRFGHEVAKNVCLIAWVRTASHSHLPEYRCGCRTRILKGRAYHVSFQE